MKRFRSLRIRSLTMPLLLAALVVRVLIPSDVMPLAGMGGALMVEASLCSTGPDRTERIEIPGDAPQLHCERCLLTPPFEAPYAFLAPIESRIVQVPLLPEQVSQAPDAPVVRAQAARAPPHA